MALLLFLLFWTAVEGSPIMVVDLRSSPPPTVIAVQTCVGLLNREADTPVWTLMSAEDSQWLAIVASAQGLKPTPTAVDAFLHQCMSTRAKGYLLFNYSQQQLVVPQLLTLAGVVDAVPLEDGSPYLVNASLVLDVTETWKDASSRSATQYLYDRYYNITSGLAIMNPGLDVKKNPVNPPLTLQPDLAFADYVVKERVFNFYMNDMCIPDTEDHALMEEMATHSPWGTPIRVYGYDDSWPIAGAPLFESETLCTKEHNLGLACTMGVNNLAFLSRAPKITTPLKQNPAPTSTYNKSMTYLALVVGDGDNMLYDKQQRFEWFHERMEKCKANPSSDCFPLLWTISPHLRYLAPDMLRWYFNASHTTGADFFVLPPSGDLYAYPGLMEEDDQGRFVTNTEDDCRILDTSATTAWEFSDTWRHAIDHYFPRYADKGVVTALFAVNVPPFLPVLEFGANEFYKVLEGKTVLFKPVEWRGTTEGSHDPCVRTPAELAKTINEYPRGTVSYIYLTSDGGANLDSYYNLVPLLQEHVRVVNHRDVASLALQRSASLEL